MNRLTVLFLFLGYAFGAFGQGVGIGTTAPDSSAVIDISSVTKGMLMPRMTTAQRDAIVSPAAGLVILNLDDYCLDIYDGTYWSKNCGLRITGADSIFDVWTAKTPFGGVARMGAASFVIDGKAYVGTGLSEVQDYFVDLWEYNPETDVWAQKANLPGIGRLNAVGFNVMGKGYVATGYSANNTYLNDVWEYTSQTNMWTQKNNFPGSPRMLSVAVERPDYQDALLVGGNPDVNDAWRYLAASDTWVQLANYPAARYGAVGFYFDGHAIVGTGVTGGAYTNDFYYYSQASNQWVFHSTFGGVARENAVAMVIGSNVYVGTGNNNNNGYFLDDVWRYNGNTGWTSVAPFSPGPRQAAEAFVINGTGFLTTGLSNGFVFNSDTWAYVPAQSLGYNYESPLPPPDAYSYSDGIWSRDSTDNVYSDVQSNVGIGTDSPDAKLHVNGSLKVAGDVLSPLKFGNTLANRKVVLWAEADNDNEFYGFGVNGGVLRYQATGDHVFYWGQNADFSYEHMRLNTDGRLGVGISAPEAAVDIARGLAPTTLITRGTDYNSLFNHDIEENTYIRGGKWNAHVFINDEFGLGNVGIGQSTANNKLDVHRGPPRSGTHAVNRPLYVTGGLQESSDGVEFRNDGGTQGIGFGFNTIYATGSDPDQDLGLASRGTGILRFSTNGGERLRITGTGNVGIGTTFPNAPLQLGNGLANRKVVLWEGQNNDHVFYGFGVNGNILRYQVSNPSDNHVFYAGTSATTSQELMRIKGNGNVTITGMIENEGYAAPSFLNGFTNYGNGYVAAGYYKDKEGIVRLRGTVTKNSSPNGQAIFVLPAGYRPSSGTVAFSVVNNGTLGVVEILWDGAVFVQNCAAGWISLDSIVFRAD